MNTDDDFYIFLDWDNIGYHQMINRINILLDFNIIQQIEIRASSSLDGYHIYIQTFSYINPTEIFRLRFEWFDDPKKLCRDMIDKKARYRDVLFSYKVIEKYGVRAKFR